MVTRLRTLGWVGTLALAASVVFLLAQAVPYGRDHSNPKPTRSLHFDSARTGQLFAGACADCHSDLTTWPWYSNVAPVSWLVQNDVDGGRSAFDVSEWDRGEQPDAEEISGVVLGGGMPPVQYKVIHGAARLSKLERQQLAAGLMRSIRADPPGGARP
jgi:mono/diheme cytochrome c family protein